MGSHELEPLEMWDLQMPTIPERSALYPLEPIGVSTPMVESLTSYVTRLSYEHCLSPGALFRTTITLHIKPGKILSDNRQGITAIWGGNYTHTSMLNGMQQTTLKVVEILKRLTGREDLHTLTVLPWREVIAAKGFLRQVKAWCPLCYEQWRLAGQILYDPLIWGLIPVQICPEHHRPLVQQCPHCQRDSALLETNTLPIGYCSKCGRWLGIALNTENLDAEALLLDDLKWQLWTVKNIGELLSAAPSFSSTVPKIRVKEVFCAYISSVTHGNINAFTRLVHQSDSTVHNWLSSKQVPQIDLLLQICSHLKTSLLDFFTKQIVDIDFSELSANLNQPQPKENKIRRRLNCIQAKTILQTALKETPPPSFPEVVKRLNTNRSSLRYWFPDLCSAISSRYSEYNQRRWLEETRLFLEAVIESNESPPPSLREVSQRFGSRGYSSKLRTYFPHMCRLISERYQMYPTFRRFIK